MNNYTQDCICRNEKKNSIFGDTILTILKPGNMFFLLSHYYYIVIVLQIICVIHSIRKGNQRWIWFIVLIPLIGCIAYIFSEMFTRREMEQVQSGVSSVLNPSGNIRKLKNNLKFRDTFDNRIALADAYLNAGQADNAIELYEKSLTGTFSDHEHGNMQLVRAYFDKGSFEKVISVTKKVYNLPQFKRTRVNMLYAIALSNNNQLAAAEKEFTTMTGKFSNYECRYEYGKFLAKNGRMGEAKKLYQEVLDEVSHLSGIEKRNNKIWFSKIKDELKKIQPV
jgi:hypothetical protein